MLGAGAAWRAARTSSQASRDARDALAVTLEPHVVPVVTQAVTQNGELGPVVARAIVVGPGPWGYGGTLPATDVNIQFTLSSGKPPASASIAVLEPTGDLWARRPPFLGLTIGEPTDDWPPPGGDHVDVVVLFSDVRRVASYRTAYSVDLHQSETPPAISFRNPTGPTTTRIPPVSG